MAVDYRILSEDVKKTIGDLATADIVVGIASFNNSHTINHVVSAVDAGLAKYFPMERSVIINSDGGSTDGTPRIVRDARFDHKTVFLSQTLSPAHRISTPYHGLPGKGSAFRTVFETAVSLGAKACCVVDADLRSITPEWMELLLVPVMREGYDFVAPLYSRHKYDGSITNSIIYPMTRTLYGKRIRQPIGGEFGFSGRLADFYLSNQDVWETDVSRFGIDIWMTTEAIAGGFNLCQVNLGAKIHDPKDPGTDLSDMFVQVMSSFFTLTERHYEHWKDVTKTVEVPTFGFKYYAGLEPINVNVAMMIDHLKLGVENLKGVWESFIVGDTIRILESLAKKRPRNFRFPAELWVSIVFEFVLAYHHQKIATEHLIKSLIPLYMGRNASFFLEVTRLNNDEAEDVIEELCVEFEKQRRYLLEAW
jgi:glycosyltransferase involved in cell wall biosynthesis